MSQEQMSGIREEPILEALESEALEDEHHWYSPSTDHPPPHHVSTRFTNGHGFDVGNARSRRDSFNSQDTDSDLEYATPRHLEQTPSNRGIRLHRLEAPELRREHLMRRIRSFPTLDDGHFTDPEDDYDTPVLVQEEDVDATPRTVDSDRFTPSRSNSFRLMQNTRSLTNAPRGSGRSAGLAQLYDISSQIEAAMNEVQRLSVRPDWTPPTISGASPSYQPTTPQTHRSCYQFSDDDHEEEEEEELEEDIDWNARLQDSVFLLDDLDSGSEVSQEFDDFEPYHEVVDFHSQDSQWVSSYDDV